MMTNTPLFIKIMKTVNFLIFFSFTTVLLGLSGCSVQKSNDQITSLGVGTNIETQGETKSNYITANDEKITIGQSFFIKSGFALEPYEFKLENINQDGSVVLSYSELRLGKPCSGNNSKVELIISANNNKCLPSITCDGGENVCLKMTQKRKNLFLNSSTNKWPIEK